MNKLENTITYITIKKYKVHITLEHCKLKKKIIIKHNSQ